MITFSGTDINQIYMGACKHLMDYYQYETAPRGMRIREELNTTLIIRDSLACIVTLPERNLSRRYLAGEFAFYFSGSQDLDFINKYSKFWNKCSDDGKTVNSCYGRLLMYEKNGKPLMDNFSYAKEQLLKDKDSRKAVMMIYRPDRHNVLDSNDNPCTVYLQFFIRDNELSLHTYMRSNDIWFGLPYDIPFFCMVQHRMHSHLLFNYPELKLGPYYHNVGSLHCYEKDFESIKKLLPYGGKLDVVIPSGVLPIWSQSTDQEMLQFAVMERRLRLGGDKPESVENCLQDDLLRTMFNWLMEEK